MTNQQFENMLMAQNLLMEIYTAIGYTRESDIPDTEKRQRIYAAWSKIGDYLEKEGVNLVY
jgi:hypothetical protein